MTAARLPAAVAVGPVTFRLTGDKRRTDDAALLGFCDHGRGEIVVDPSLPADRLRVIVLHELLHAAIDLAGCADTGKTHTVFTDADHEESLVRPLAPVLTAMLRDNPRLVAYLTGKDTP